MDNTKTEKLSFNFTAADLAAIDALIDQGFYKNRTDFVMRAVHSRIDKEQPFLDKFVAKKELENFVVGITYVSNAMIQKILADDQTTSIKSYGLLIVDKDIDIDAMRQAVTSIKAYGIVKAPAAVKKLFSI